MLTENSDLFEKKLYESIHAAADTPIPPFDALAARIAANEPTESYEAFFGGEDGYHLTADVAAVSKKSGAAWYKTLGMAAAAVAVLVVGSGLVMALLVGSMRCGSAEPMKDEAVYEATAQVEDYDDSFYDAEQGAEDSAKTNRVSDSDLQKDSTEVSSQQ